MDVPLVMLDLDGVFRKYARANSVKLAFTLGSTLSVTISVNVLKELFTVSARGIQRIPTPLKIAFGAAIAAALIHPKSRAKIMEWGKTLWNKLNSPKVRALFSSLVMQLAELALHGRSSVKIHIRSVLSKQLRLSPSLNFVTP